MTLEQLGWSQENVAYVIGITRPTYRKYLSGGDNLTLEQAHKLRALERLQMTYKAFEREAIAQHAFERVWKPAYKTLQTVTAKDTPNGN